MRRWTALVPVMALLLSGCLLQRPAGEGTIRFRDTVFAGVTVTDDQVYGHNLSQTGAPTDLRYDLYEPAGDTSERRPLIIWVHGGSFSAGNENTPEIVDQANFFARKGYVNASISYRLSATGCTRIDPVCLESIVDATEDAQAAVRYFRANAATFGIDPERIAIAGTSAGAITAMNVGFGAEVSESSGTPGVSSEVSGAVALSGARLLGSCDPDDAPALVFNGTNDPLTPYAWAENTVACAETGGTWAHLVTWEGQGHVPYVANRDQILELQTNFFYHSLTVALLAGQ